VAFEQVDQLDLSVNAFVKGVEAEPQQPQLLSSRLIASASSRYVVMAKSTAVSEPQHKKYINLGFHVSILSC